MSGRRSRAGRAISRRLQTPKPKGTAAELIRELQKRPEHKGLLACGYGVHDREDDQPEAGYWRCGRCGATYAKPLAVAS